MRARLLEGEEAVVTSELTRLELASAISVAARAGRLRRPRLFLDRFDADCNDDGPIVLLRLDPETVFPLAHRLLMEYEVRTLDAIHLAVASTSARELAGEEPVVFVTRDQRQAAAAIAVGLTAA